MYLLRNLDLLLYSGSRKSIMAATYNDSSANSDVQCDEVVQILMGNRPDITVDMACALIAGRIRDDYNFDVMLKVMLIMRRVIVSHYVSTKDLEALNGDGSLIAEFKTYDKQGPARQMIREYGKGLSSWIGLWTDRKILHKDMILTTFGIWDDLNPKKGNWERLSKIESTFENYLNDWLKVASRLLKSVVDFSVGKDGNLINNGVRKVHDVSDIYIEFVTVVISDAYNFLHLVYEGIFIYRKNITKCSNSDWCDDIEQDHQQLLSVMQEACEFMDVASGDHDRYKKYNPEAIKIHDASRRSKII